MANRGGWGSRSFRGGKGVGEAHTFPAGEEGSVRGLRGFLPPSADTAVGEVTVYVIPVGGCPLPVTGKFPCPPTNRTLIASCWSML